MLLYCTKPVYFLSLTCWFSFSASVMTRVANTRLTA
uniref:Uncharacterized protein n=1 Tax=Arundo donax TaxID=35708 RepID=A0A0A9HFX7_ARUDO